MSGWRNLLVGAAGLLVVAADPAFGAEPVRLHAAGSLRAALTEVAHAFVAATTVPVAPVFGASGLLRERLAAGEGGDVFASADLGNPRALATAGKAGPVAVFARNRLCALLRPGLRATPDELLGLMLDPSVKLGTSTPRADPSGDYAWAMFARAETIRPGSKAALEVKALKLVGGADSPPPPTDRSVYGMLIERGAADLLLTYCTNGRIAAREVAGITVVDLPDGLAVGADYGLTILTGARDPQSSRFAFFVLSPDGQAILAKHGFDAPTVPRFASSP